LYAALSRAFAFPQRSFHQEVVDGRWLEGQRELLAALPHRLSTGERGSWRVPADYDRFQSEFIRLFEVGSRGRASCPLYSGHYAVDRLRAMEELVRFYNFFGLRPAPGLMPDHLVVELEFVHYLAFKEAEDGADKTSFQLAQRDFLERHLTNWLPRLSAALKGERPLPFYRSLVALTNRFLAADRAYLAAALDGER
jgi:DMSO reductase family type II enzyme chaperone